MSPTIPLPQDSDLTPDVRNVLAALPPLNIFRMLANAPQSVQGFVQLGASILRASELDARLREIAILRVAHVTEATYEWEQHVIVACGTGVADHEIAAIGADPVRGLDDDALLICRAADEISRDVRLSDEALEALLARYGTRQTTELILCISYYNMVSLFLESTRVELDAGLHALHAKYDASRAANP